MKAIEKFVLATTLGVAIPAAGACGSQAGTSHEEETTGTLAIPLSTTTQGVTYRLVNASIYIYPAMYGQSTYLSVGPDGDPADLTATLATGSYEADLNSWALEREDAQGQFEPVDATLTSSSYVPFTIDNGTTTTVTFTFQTDGVSVIVGSGSANIAISVDQADAACTPLGTGCPAGSWCPPATLTGADLACVVAGSVGLGQTCTGPEDCIANASCFATGEAGTVCLALCSASGAPCPSGSVCQTVTSEYGVCEP